MKSLSTKQRAALLVVAILAIVGAVYFTVLRNSGTSELILYGNIDIRDVTLGFRVPGRVGAIAVDEGDSVRAGQELARLDTTPIELEVREARANAAAIGARVALLKAGFRSEDISQARATVAERQAALANAEQQLARQEQLKGTGAVAQRVYDEALAARDQSRARLDAAQASLTQMQSGYRVQEVAEAEANQQRGLAVASQAQQRLIDAVLRASADGIVLTRAIESGAIVGAGTPAFTLSLRSPVWARVYVAEPDLGKAAEGSSVLLYTDSRPDRPYHGRVGFVSPTAEFTPKNVETPDLRTALVYRARIVVSDADQGLRQGMPITVKLADRTAATATK